MKPRSSIIKGKLLILIGCSFFFCHFLSAQSSALDTTATIFKEFQRDTVLELRLKTDTKQLIKNKFEEEWQPVTLNIATKDNQSILYNAKLKTRGNIRKKVCYYPPLKLKFKKEWLDKRGLDSTYNDLKLVVRCKKGPYYNKLVLKEYLTYQLYAALTEYSFKTQLVSLKIIDSKKESDTIETLGFIIENQEEMAARFNGRCTKPKIMRSKSVDAKQWAFLSLFEFMIGNTDWAMASSHNVRYIVNQTNGKAIPIAYDFDYSGIVDAVYAAHRESIKTEEITTRYFLGSCEIQDQLEQELPLFIDKKARLYKIINDFDLLPAKERKEMIKYLDEFYKIISKSKFFKRSILDKCIKK